MILAFPDPPTDQCGEARHQGFWTNAPATDLGKGCPKKGPALVPFWCLVWMPQVLHGFWEFGQQGGRTTAMDQREKQANASADQYRPGQGWRLAEGLFNRTAPKLLCGEINQPDDQCHASPTCCAGEQRHQAEAQLVDQMFVD
jgi:hypothetical protein